MTLSFVRESCVPPHIAHALKSGGPVNILTRIGNQSFDILRAVHDAGDDFIRALKDPLAGTLPNVILFPDQIHHLSALLFSSQRGFLPAFRTAHTPANLSTEQYCQESKMATASVLLCLARRFQTSHTTGLFGTFEKTYCAVDALVLLLHYLAASLFPNASTFNDIGVILCGLDAGELATTTQSQQISGREVARSYYEKGLQLDPSHPHLLSNLGSLLKDAGHTSHAIGVFNHALMFHPELDIALINMGNALKDTGHCAEAVPYYLRAISVNPDFPDAYCGLSQSMNAICQWNERAIWMQKAIEVCEKQLSDAYCQSIGLLCTRSLEDWMVLVRSACSGQLSSFEEEEWIARFRLFLGEESHRSPCRLDEAGFLIRLMEWYQTRMQRSWYIKAYGRVYRSGLVHPTQLPDACTTVPDSTPLPSIKCPRLPFILPFHTFTFPLTTRAIRLIAHRNALNASFAALTLVGRDLVVRSPPPPPPHGRINVGYVSADFSDHPLTHLMKSGFTMHDKKRFNVFLYATSPTDGSSHRQYYERQTDFRFIDTSAWSINNTIDRIVEDQIHIRWCDYLVCDPIVCPPDLFVRVRDGRTPRSSGPSPSNEICPDIGVPVNEGSDPASPHTYFVTDHKQSYNSSAQGTASQRWRDELRHRDELRASIFPDLPKDVFIFANFNQTIFLTWLRVLSRVQRSILWLLRFPAAGESNLLQTALEWAGPEVASRIRFTDVAPKEHHIARCCVADLVLDTAECSAHTIAADVLWSGTPIVACLFPSHRHKMSSRVAASLAYATGLGEHMVVHSQEEYEDRAVALASMYRQSTAQLATVTGTSFEGQSESGADAIPQSWSENSELLDLRRRLFLGRDTMPLFDTQRWVRNLEKGLNAAWNRWVDGLQFQEGYGGAGSIAVKDDDDTLLTFA
ncbi:glycosyltransferase family 41 protein [Melanogaster broomeanus]|nr:glycosyltransferase family 41 protein [Melanogaster broomeanus]